MQERVKGDLRRHVHDLDTYVGDESYGDESDDGFNPWEAENSEEDEYSMDEANNYGFAGYASRKGRLVRW